MLAARALARELLMGSDAVYPSGHDLAQVCAKCGGCHGTPTATEDGFHLSWSHSRGWVAAGVSRHPIGVDVEAHQGRWRQWGLEALMTHALTDTEKDVARSSNDPHQAFLMAWTSKEALTKAGILDIDQFGNQAVLLTGGRVREEVLGCVLRVKVTADYTVAVAAASRCEPEWAGAFHAASI
ncbi:4'-phosphopantetheinyl transferase family protein [Microbacterium sp.]|uniref:4'-phosphopantetheinyl transferase family protein n=1 Tax=Microbacterium sp. TaxID=51671 RepID=UPI0039E71380